MFSIKVKVGSKGPKTLREAYGIKRVEKFIVIPSEEGLLIKRRKSAEEIIRILKNTGKRKKKNITGKLWGDLANLTEDKDFHKVPMNYDIISTVLVNSSQLSKAFLCL